MYTQDPIVNSVIQRIVDRSNQGMVKFGHTMAEDTRPVITWIDDAIEELLDAANYLEALKHKLVKLIVPQ